MGRWYGKNDEPLNKYESDCIEQFKFSYFSRDLIYTYHDFELHNQNIITLTSYDTGLLKIKGDIGDPIQIKLKFEKRIYDDKKLTSKYIDPFGTLLNYEKCKYVLKDTHAESLSMMINENLHRPPERSIQAFGNRYLDEKLKSYSTFFQRTLTELHKRDSEYLLSDYVFCFTGIQMYSTISELIELISKFGGRYIYVQDKSRSTALYANKKFPAKYDAKDITTSQNKELILLHGYDPEDCIRFKSNPISIGYPHIINSNKYQTFTKFKRYYDNLKIIDEIELLSAIKEYRKIHQKHMEPQTLIDNDCDTAKLFTDGERQIMSWIQSVHNFGGRGTKAFIMFSKIAQNPEIEKIKTVTDAVSKRSSQIKLVFGEMKKHDVPEHILQLAETRITAGVNLKVGNIKKFNQHLEGFTGKYVKSSEILGSFKRNFINDDIHCGDVDVLLTCVGNKKRKCIEEYEEYISMSLWNDIKDYVSDTNIEEAVIPIDNGNKFRKYIIYIKLDGQTIIPIRLDVKVATKGDSEEYTMRLHQTGSSVFNTVMSNIARDKGYKLSQLGLEKDGEFYKVNSEQEILEFLLEKPFLIKFYSQLPNRNKENVGMKIKDSKFFASVPQRYHPVSD